MSKAAVFAAIASAVLTLGGTPPSAAEENVSLNLLVESASGSAVRDADVDLRDGSGFVEHVKTDGSGRFRFIGLSSGIVTVHARADIARYDREFAYASCRLEAPSAATGTLRLRKALRMISGVFIGPANMTSKTASAGTIPDCDVEPDTTDSYVVKF